MDTERGFDPDVWAQMSDQMGLPALTIPEAYGGQGFTSIEQVVVLEEMGRALLCAPYFSSAVLAANTLLHSGDNAAQAAHLPGIASGETRATLAFTEQNGRWDEPGVTMTATSDNGAWRLDGVKMYVLDGHTANLILVAARTADGVSLFTVEPDADGLERTALSTMDQTRKQAKVELRRCVRAEPSSASRRRRMGRYSTRSSTSPRWRSPRSRSVAPRCCFDMSVEYAKVRVQFGRPIGSFQAIKHKCADMLLEVESAKSAAYYAGWCAAEMNDELAQVASLAKSYCSEAYFHAAAENIQIHGGIGFTWEHPGAPVLQACQELRAAVRRPDLSPRAPRSAHRNVSSRRFRQAAEPPQRAVGPGRFGPTADLADRRRSAWRMVVFFDRASCRWRSRSRGRRGWSSSRPSGRRPCTGWPRRSTWVADRLPGEVTAGCQLRRLVQTVLGWHLDWFASVGLATEHGQDARRRRRGRSGLRGGRRHRTPPVDAVVARSLPSEEIGPDPVDVVCILEACSLQYLRRDRRRRRDGRARRPDRLTTPLGNRRHSLLGCGSLAATKREEVVQIPSALCFVTLEVAGR